MSFDLAMLVDHNSRGFNVTIAAICGLLVLSIHVSGLLKRLSTLMWQARLRRRKARRALRASLVPIVSVELPAHPHVASEHSDRQPHEVRVSA